MGAQPVPRIKGGKWPWNMDLAINLARVFETEYLGDQFRVMYEENGDIFNMDILGRDIIWLTNPNYLKEMLATQFPNFVKGKSLHTLVESVLGNGIFSSDGDIWKHHRSMTRPFFTRDRVTDFDTFDQHAETLIRKLRERCDSGMPVDFQEAITQFSMGSATEFLFGHCAHALSVPLSYPGQSFTAETEHNAFTLSLQSVLGLIDIRLRMKLPWQLNEIFGDPTLPHMKVINDYLSPIIDSAERDAQKKKDFGREDNLLSFLVSRTSDRKEIQDELLNIFIAGRDTTASNLTFVVYLLATHASVLARLRQEVLDSVGATARPTFDNIKDMKYLRAVINETLRLFPPVPFNMKESVNDTVFTDPETGVKHFIPAKTACAFSTLGLHRSPKLWGPDALKYDPERWLDERNQKYFLANPFIFIPFLAGPRICLGQQFAYNEISFFLIRFLQQFERIELAPDGHPPGTLPPPEWKNGAGRMSIEKIWPKSRLTAYSNLSDTRNRITNCWERKGVRTTTAVSQRVAQDDTGDQYLPAWVKTPLGFVVLTTTCVILRVVLTNSWNSYHRHRDLKRMGAQPIPKIKGGKWPWNVDIAYRISSVSKTEYLGELIGPMCEENGDLFHMDILGKDIIWVTNPNYIKEMLATQFPNFIKGPSLHATLESALGTGIFNSDGEAWKHHRSMTRPFFTRDRVTDFDTFDRHAETLIRKLRERCDSGMPVDFQEAITQFSMDSATEFLFGHCAHALSTPLSYPGHSTIAPSEHNAFAHSLQFVLDHIASRIRKKYPWQLSEISGDPTRQHMKVISDYINPMIDAAERDVQAKKDVGGEDNLLSYLVSRTADRKAVQDELLNIFIAGRDTTASNLTFAIYFLAMHPHVLARLRREILDSVGATQRPTVDNIKNMKYLRAVINETLRLFPSVPFNIKESVRDTVFTNLETGLKYFVPAKTTCAFSTIEIHRSTRFWGPDALEFDPDRWLDERNQKYFLANPFIFIPFLAGPRICLGQQFAYNEISFFLIRFLQQFDQIKLAPDGHAPNTLPPLEWRNGAGRKSIEQIWPKRNLTAYSNGGLWVRLS
ncbi:hypothetical protein FRB97_006028 [Tulasnella sp. 331]|nr:hypothetical protein FRB97_006028 [Tulasnella sp. 331]